LLYFSFLESLVISDPDFQHEDLNFLSRSERYDAAVRKSAQMILKLREYGISDPEEIYSYKRYAYLSRFKKLFQLLYIWYGELFRLIGTHFAIEMPGKMCLNQPEIILYGIC